MTKYLVIFFILIINLYSGEYNWTYPESGTSKRLTKIHVVDSLTAYCVGVSGTVIKTIDGCQTWENVNINSRSHLHKVFFVDEENGWVGGQLDMTKPDNYLFFTSDGGSSWIPKDIDVEYSVTGIYFVNKNVGYVVDYYGNLFKTTNNGDSWEKIHKFEAIIYQLYVFDNKLFVVGKYGYFSYAEMNDSSTWIDKSIETNYDISSISSYKNNIIVAGTKGLCYKYNVNDEIWEDMSLETIFDCWGITSNDKEIIVAGGRNDGNGLVGILEDKEQDWLLYNFNGENFTFNDVKKITNEKFIAVGKFGAVALADRKTSDIKLKNNSVSVSIVPQPANDYIIINNLENIHFLSDISIFDSMGNFVKDVKMDKSKIIDISEFSSGVYFIRFNQADKLFSKSFIISK